MTRDTNMRAVRTDPVAPSTSRRMSRTRSRDNLSELRLRSWLFREGIRFRVHYKAIPGARFTVDIALTRRRIAIFLDGCFWHGCPIHGSTPKNNGAWWARKFAENQARDLRVNNQLAALGWTVIRIWEHEPFEELTHRIRHLLAVASSPDHRPRLASRQTTSPQ